MSVHAQTIIQRFEQFAPKRLAVEGDKIGLQIGSLDKQVSRILVALDVTEEVAEEAIVNDVDLIIAHHPVLFRPVHQIRTDLPYGRILQKLLHHDITVYAAHTNLDITVGGVNDWLADRLGLVEPEVLVPTGHETLKKLIVFVPVEDEEKLRKALGDAGAGHIGNYSHCSFRTEGTGAFLPGEGADPHIGKRGQMEQVREVKIETLFPASIEKQVLNAMQKAHPYEEVAYDVYVLDQPGQAYGLGRIGKLSEEISLQRFAEFTKQVLQVPRLRLVGDPEARIRKVAVLGGSGSKYASSALRQGADVYVTGDVDYHTACDAKRDGLNIVDPGHHVEKVMIEGVADLLEREAAARRDDVKVFRSVVHPDPFSFV